MTLTSVAQGTLGKTQLSVDSVRCKVGDMLSPTAGAAGLEVRASQSLAGRPEYCPKVGGRGPVKVGERGFEKWPPLFIVQG